MTKEPDGLFSICVTSHAVIVTLNVEDAVVI